MSFTNQQRSQDEIEETIKKALKKIGSNKENDLCKYLPAEKGGYMHHFTLRKMKTEEPSQLIETIKRHVINADSPCKVAPKPRAARGSRKKRDVITLTRGDVERLLDISRQVGDKEMVAKLSPKKSLAALRRDLVKAIRDGNPDTELWNSYVETMTHQAAHASSQTSFGTVNPLLTPATATR